jgi:hypothetical protein
MARGVRLRRLAAVLAALFVLSFVLSACSAAADGAPSQPGQYDVQKDSIRFDGDRYQLFWADQNGTLHQMDTRKLRLVRDPDRTFLEVPQSGDPILHLREDEPITVEGQDRQGAFSSPWFPFLLGTAVGNVFGGRGGNGQTVIINNPAPGETGSYSPNTPAYRYPPTGSFGRDDELHGSLDTSKPAPPDYSKVQPAPYATTGKSSGTGGGSAASNKSPGSGAGAGGGLAGNSSATSGEAGGTGGGTAASSKGGFRSGSQSYSNSGDGSSSSGGSKSVGAGSNGALSGGGSTGGTGSKPSTGVSGSKPSGGSSNGGSKGIGGARAGGGGRR